jgi:hypothetical protein
MRDPPVALALALPLFFWPPADDGREEDGRQDCEDRDHHGKLDERECPPDEGLL